MADEKKVALVTGAARGIGRGIALRLAQSGFAVAINYARDQKSAEETVRLITEGRGVAKVFGCDVSDFEAVAAMAKAVKQDLGPVAVLVNNAGIARDMSILRLSPGDWSQVQATNLNGSFYCIKSVVFNMMKHGWGRIINIGSLSWHQGLPGQAAYAASKAGLVGLTRCLSTELAPSGITVNLVIPGIIPTDMWKQTPAEALDSLGQNLPAKRLGTPEDVAEIVDFLASDRAGYISGQVMAVDGGLSCTLGLNVSGDKA